MLSLAVVLEDSARRHPDRVAVRTDTETLSYATLDVRASALAALLEERGVRPGDRVALTCPNTAWFPAVYFGILKAGAVVVPLNVMLKAREIAYHLEDSGASLHICHVGTEELPTGAWAVEAASTVDGCLETILLSSDRLLTTSDGDTVLDTETLVVGPETRRTALPRSADDTAVILYTSGTTGRPKGAELSHSNMLLNALTANRLFDSSPLRHDTYLVTLPLFHSFGQTVLMNAGLAVGGTLRFLPRFDAATALGVMAAEAVTVFAGVPTMYWAMLGVERDAVDLHRIAETLRAAISGGAALPVDIHSRFHERFGVRIVEGYGLSETSPLALFSDPEQDPRPGSIGVPVWGVEAGLLDTDGGWLTGPDQVGELVLRGHNVMTGYLNRPEATAAVLQSGWFRTGDLARRDADGFYYIVDRVKDLIVRGGYNVYPREVEEVLLSHRAVSLAAVVGVPDDSLGEEVKAFVILDPGVEPVGEDELVAWCREVMAAYKYPRSVEFVEGLPMTATGKILKRELTTLPGVTARS